MIGPSIEVYVETWLRAPEASAPGRLPDAVLVRLLGAAGELLGASPPTSDERFALAVIAGLRFCRRAGRDPTADEVLLELGTTAAELVAEAMRRPGLLQR